MQLLQNGKAQFVDQNGFPLVSGTVGYYAPGTLNPIPTYQDSAGTIANTNPIALDGRGQAIIWGSGTYRQIVKDVFGVTIWDQIVTSADAEFIGSNGASLIGFDGGTLATFFLARNNRVVDSIAALRSLSKLTYTRVWATGYYAPHDGGGGAYQYDPSDTTSADNGGTIIVATDGGRWKLQYMGSVCWNQFGAKGDGVTDDTAAIQAGINAVTGLFYGLGSTYFTTGVTIDKNYITFAGTNKATTLTGTSLTADIISVGSAGGNPGEVVIKDLFINTSVTKTAGAAIHFKNGHSCEISGVRFIGNQYTSIQLDGGSGQFNYKLFDFEINAGVNGIVIGLDSSSIQDVFMDRAIIAGVTNGITCPNVSGLYMSNMDILGCTTGINFDPSSGQTVSYIFASEVLADTCTQNGMQLICNGTGSIHDATFSNCWFSSNGTGLASGSLRNGVFVSQGATGKLGSIVFDGCRIVNNQGAGISFSATTSVINGSIIISNSQIQSNSQDLSNDRSGIEIAPNFNNFIIIGNKIGLGSTFSFNNQAFGILINAGTSGNFQVIGNDLTGNVSGGMSDGSTGVRWVYGNAGYITSNSGAAQLPASATSASIAHGLSKTPLVSEILLTPTVDIASGGATANRYWVSAVTATTFTISTAVASSGALFFAWQARTSGA